MFRTGVPKSEYEFKIDFYKEIIPDVLILIRIVRYVLTPNLPLQGYEKTVTSRSVVLKLRKKDAEKEYWPRLTKEKVKNAYIKTDFSKWVDEDEQEETSPAAALDNEMDFGGMDMGGGMPGGMPGMPGLGNLGGGGMDFSKVC